MTNPIERAREKVMIEFLRKELFALCEDTEEQCRDIAQRDTEGKQGAYARGRMYEAKSIRKAMGEVFRLSFTAPPAEREWVMGKWRSVSEKPKKRGFYLVYCTQHPPQSLPWQIVEYRDDWLTSWEPTYWQPLTTPSAERE